jgi:predicted PurR-regulated permease PerM
MSVSAITPVAGDVVPAGVESRVSAPRPHTPRWAWAWALPLVLILFLYLARAILGPFIIAGVLAYIFSPVVDQVQERVRLPRAVAVGLLYLLVLGALGTGLFFGADALYQQTRDFITKGPNIIEQGLSQVLGNSRYSFAGQTWDAHLLAARLTEALGAYLGNGAGSDAFHLARAAGGRLLDSLLVIIVSFYLLVSGKHLGASLLRFMPADSRAQTGYVAGRIHTMLGAYLRGQLLLIVLISCVAFVILQFVFQVPYALPLAILTGFLEILPLVGPAIATGLAAGVALAVHGPGAAAGVAVAYVVMRELEDNLVMPFVVGRSVEVAPVVTIFAVLAGGAIAGVLGMLLAVPTAAAIKVLLDFLYPTHADTALAQARPGLKQAAREAEAED